MKLYYPITVDLYNLYPLKKMDAQQYNVGRGALVTLTAAGQVIALDSETATLWAKKLDNTVSYLPCTVVNGQIKADFTNQMLALVGSVQVELRMIAGQDNITTPIFTVEVHPSNIDDDAVESQNEFTALQAAVSAMNTALQEVDELKQTGLKGDPGEPGADGAPGAAATIAVGAVTAGAPGTAPQVTNSGTSNAAVFDFVIPRGEQGPAGAEQVYFGAFSDFPTTGNSEMLYVDTSNTSVLLMYRWNGTAYVPSGGGAADLDVVAQEFDATKAYTKGTYVIYSGGLYCFTSDKAAGAWDASAVTPTTVGVELADLNAKMSEIKFKTYDIAPRNWGAGSNEVVDIDIDATKIRTITGVIYNESSMYVMPSPPLSDQGQYLLAYSINLVVSNNKLIAFFAGSWPNYGMHIVIGYVD